MEQKVDLTRIYDPRGSLTVVENMKSLPFEIGKVSWMGGMTNDTPAVEHTATHTMMVVALSGSFSLEAAAPLLLNRPYQGVIIEEGTRYKLHGFSYGAVCLLIESR